MKLNLLNHERMHFDPPIIGEAKYIRQSGCPGRYGYVRLQLETPAAFETHVIWDITNDEIPIEYASAVVEGCLAAMTEGRQAGATIEAMTIRIIGGRFHEVDSDAYSFRVAAHRAMATALRNAGILD